MNNVFAYDVAAPIPDINNLAGNIGLVAAIVVGLVLLIVSFKFLKGAVRIIMLAMSLGAMSGSFALKDVITRLTNSDVYQSVESQPKEACIAKFGPDSKICKNL
jgi:hypothetical protein